MKIPPTLLKMEDYPDFEGERKERLVRTLNAFFNAVAQAVNGGLTAHENLAALSKDVTFKGEPVTVECVLPGNRKPVHVLVTKATEDDVPCASGTPGWTSAASERGGYAVKIHSIPNYSAGKTYRLTLLVLGA